MMRRMDNSMFAVDYFTIFPGADLAYVAHGLTVQAEATLFQLTRVRGKDTVPGKDSSNTNLTAGLHVGYFVIPQFSVGVELRHQRWLDADRDQVDRDDDARYRHAARHHDLCARHTRSLQAQRRDLVAPRHLVFACAR